ncbi:MAG TPA: gephyrin-like molybdotransferase Glp [Chloroflexia bacterium]
MAERGLPAADACYPKGLLGVDDAIARLVALARERRPGVETMALAQAAGRVLAQDLVARRDVPPEANSAMDGIAFRLADLPASGEMRISQRIPAGVAPVALEPGTAARIFTGAILPSGADTVAMQEHCDFGDGRVRLRQCPAPGANVRPAGQDVAAGQVMLGAGSRLGAAALGLAAAAGLAALPVYRPLRVAILCSGDELLEPGEPWRSAAIYNSNRPMLAALLRGWDVDVTDLGKVADTPAATTAALARAAATGADVIVSTGGVSVGEEDHVRAALERAGALAFWKVAIKPGKPVAVGRLGDSVFLGLPGNPQSVFVTALLLARPFLLAAQGQAAVAPPQFPVAAGFATRKAGDRREYLRVRCETGPGGLRLSPHPQQSSGALLSAAWADGLALVEAGVRVEEGVALPFLPFAGLLSP